MVKWMLALVIALCGTVVFADNQAGGAAGQQPAAADQGKKDDVKADKKDKKAAKKAKKARKGKKGEEKKADAAPAAPAQK